ncbi:hypothetical protein G6F21_014420 [Rhizopus arrhizus]|nr:hypothetical protein G6F21_014420 [Rhizopus arrhizus]
MTATVHQARLGGLVTEVVILGHGQGVHVGAQPDHAPAVAALAANHAHHAGLAQPRVDFQAPFTQAFGHQVRRARLLEGQFGMGMDIPAQRGQFRVRADGEKLHT